MRRGVCLLAGILIVLAACTSAWCNSEVHTVINPFGDSWRVEFFGLVKESDVQAEQDKRVKKVVRDANDNAWAVAEQGQEEREIEGEKDDPIPQEAQEAMLREIDKQGDMSKPTFLELMGMTKETADFWIGERMQDTGTVLTEEDIAEMTGLRNQIMAGGVEYWMSSDPENAAKMTYEDWVGYYLLKSPTVFDPETVTTNAWMSYALEHPEVVEQVLEAQ